MRGSIAISANPLQIVEIFGHENGIVAAASDLKRFRVLNRIRDKPLNI